MSRVRGGTGIAVAVLLIIAGCSSSSDGANGSTGTTVAGAACPTEPVQVVVTVDQWGDIVRPARRRLRRGHHGHPAAATSTPTTSSPPPPTTPRSPTPTWSSMNGLDYDHWADNAVDTLSPEPAGRRRR